MNIITLILSLIILGVTALVLYKIWKIHLASFELVDKARDIHSEIRNLYPQIQAYIDLRSLLEITYHMPVLRGWAASPDFLLLIARHTLEKAPKTIVECSSGATTIVLARCMQMQGNGHVYSLEHDPKFAQITRSNLALSKLSEWATVIDAPLKQLNEMPDHIWYSTDKISSFVNIDMLVIDGPPWNTCKFARYPSIPMLKDRFSQNCSIFLDDAARSDEQWMVKKWLAECSELTSEYMPLEKGAVKIKMNNISHSN